MKHLKQFYYFLKRRLTETSENFTENLTLARSVNGSPTSCKKKLYQHVKGSMTLSGAAHLFETSDLKGFNPSSKSTPKSLKKKNLKKEKLEISDYVISQQGQLCHKHLIALELNTIYQSQYENLMFGFDGKK